jgi:hypothetical protein
MFQNQSLNNKAANILEQLLEYMWAEVGLPESQKCEALACWPLVVLTTEC